MIATADRRQVVVVGAGAAGALMTLHLARAAAQRSVRLDVLVIDPSSALGAGTAFGTRDEAHLLNVPASGMSALPEDPAHFVAWRRRTCTQTAGSDEFAPRRSYAHYLDHTVRAALANAGERVRLTVQRRTAVRIDRCARTVLVGLDDGSRIQADAVVLATGLAGPGCSWAPDELVRSDFFIADPWAPGALDVVSRDRTGPADVLLVGTGLTMVDIAVTLGQRARQGRVLHAISRSGLLPHRHAAVTAPPVIPEVADWGSSLAEQRIRMAAHIRHVEATTGDWRPGIDGLRHQLSTLWSRLSESDRLAFLAEDAGAWNRMRHRMPPRSAAAIDGLLRRRGLTLNAATVQRVRALAGGGLHVTLDDGSERDVGWVINATGPRTDIRTWGNPLVDDVLRIRDGGVRLATVSTAGLGLRTRAGRLVDSTGRTSAPVWALGALLRGDLWESTAVPEIRAQAHSLATAVLDQIAPARLRSVVGGLATEHERREQVPHHRGEDDQPRGERHPRHDRADVAHDG